MIVQSVIVFGLTVAGAEQLLMFGGLVSGLCILGGVGAFVYDLSAYRKQFSPEAQMWRQHALMADAIQSTGVTGTTGHGGAQPHADRSTHSRSVTPDPRTGLGRSVPPSLPPAGPLFSEAQDEATEVNLRG